MINDLSDFITNLVFSYLKHNNTSYHEVVNDVDVEDICDYFIFFLDSSKASKQKDLLDKFDKL